MPLDRDLEHTAAALRPDLPEITGERVDTPEADRLVACPTCQARSQQPCTQPTDTGRKPVSWAHSARHDAAIGWLQMDDALTRPDGSHRLPRFR